MAEQKQEHQLERTLDFAEALTIGVGTMIGAGIFIFPGIAAGEAGPAAIISFGIGGVISVFVALCVSELATAMPRSGGTYHFISEGLGKPLGAVVGVSLWWGLIFASSFYLLGFGTYLNRILARLGTDLEVGLTGLGIGTAIVLTAVNILGTEKSGDLQDIIVFVLLGILTVFLGYGLLDALGLFGRIRIPEAFAPHGAVPVLTTAALVYTSYLGFAQIANVAGEIKKPDRNLPRAMIGSVLLVTVFYGVTIFVSTSVFGSGKLAELGKTALPSVAQEFFGLAGSVVILSGGALATISSANASMMSSSRSVYALSSSHLLPDSFSAVNESFGTPHYSVVATGVPIILLIGIGDVELLAEVASFLHLIMYGLMCVAVIRLRRRRPDWYTPSFRTPGYPMVPIIGALSSFGLIFFMERLSQVIGVVISLLAFGWYILYTRLTKPEES
jgi:amino acid transporter